MHVTTAWATAAVLARLPGNMAPIGLILVLPTGSGAWAAGGFTAGIGLGAGWRGRALDRARSRAGLRREAFLLAGTTAVVAAVIAVHAPVAAIVSATAVMGIAGSAVGMGFRAVLPALVPAARTDSAYAADAVLTELSFVVSPVLAGVIAATTPPPGLFVAGAVLAAVSALTCAALPDRAPLEQVAGHSRGWVRAGAAVYLITASIGLGYGLLMAGLPARLAAAGWSGTQVSGVFCAMSATSAVVGLVVAVRGGLATQRLWLAAVLTAPFTLGTVALAAGTPGPLTPVAMAVFGIPLAALSTLASVVLTSRVPADTRARALAFMTGTITVAAGAGLVLAAVLLDRYGPAAVLAASCTVFAAMSGVLCVLAVMRLFS